MRPWKHIVFGAMLGLVVLVACARQAEVSPTATAPVPQAAPVAATTAPSGDLALAAFQKGGCGACHIIPGVPNARGTIGPDLTNIAQVAAQTMQSNAYTGNATTVEAYLREAILEPDVFIASDCNGSPCQKGVMPPSLGQGLSEEELAAVVAYLKAPPGEAEAVVTEEPTAAPAEVAPTLSDDEFAWAKLVYFERCAGCHGTLRKGATGPALTPDHTIPLGTVGLSTIIYNGTSHGMPDWGKQGFFTQQQIDVLARFLQREPPAPPELPLERMKGSWKVYVAPDQRPTTPQTKRNWQNYFRGHAARRRAGGSDRRRYV